jgi:hypothetical protein
MGGLSSHRASPLPEKGITRSDPALGFRRPRGLRFGPGDHLYCVGEDHVVAFDFSTGGFVGPVVQLPRRNGQALVLLE